MKKKMFYGANNLIFERAKELRGNLTHAELVLWGYLKQRPLGFKFRRQHPLGIYIVDFYCHALNLVIEVDGSIHDSVDIKVKDEQRQKDLKNDGLVVLRFRNEQVEKHLELVIEQIVENLTNSKKPL
jgi:cyclase